MKNSPTLALLLLVLATFWTFKSLMPKYEKDGDLAKTKFSTDRALEHVKLMSGQQHGVGFEPAHQNVHDYIVDYLTQLGLEPQLQEGYVLSEAWGNLCYAKNIMARIKGTEDGKALMLLSHYDSSPHSSFGASDAASGVATILEGTRAFLEENKKPKNDIILLLTDAEEIGLNGAQLFVNEHPWIKDVGLILNFEARGSGGPSIMLMETNRGNQKLITEFVKANPEYPVANSLVYSIYKMLPNDTDLTVFRRDADIEGFNFAFIDDHFDYHTSLDTFDRLNKESLSHQGSYLMPLLYHFSGVDLTNLKSLNDIVYFSIPLFNVVTYPFDWIWGLLILATITFSILIVIGFRKKVLTLKGILLGFIPMLIVLILTGLYGYFFWDGLTWWYPGFKDMLHGFTYVGHTYITALSLVSLATCLLIYREFQKVSTPNLLVAPIFLWLILCTILNLYLKGANFFLVPLFGLLVGLLVWINQKQPNPHLLAFLALPAIAIFTPFIKMFPVGLGLKMMIAATLMTTFTFFFVLPFFGIFKRKRALAAVLLLVFFILNLYAHLNSYFSESMPKPSSLVYVYDNDNQKAEWATYDNVLTDWNSQFLQNKMGTEEGDAKKTITSKYGSRFRYVAEAPLKQIKTPDLLIEQDTIIGEYRKLNLCVKPNRNVNRLEVYSNQNFSKARVNGIEFSEDYLNNMGQRLLTHQISNNAATEIELQWSKDEVLELGFYESSNDLLEHSLFTVPNRPKDQIPMPFVLNDAILVTKTLTFE
ncbi:M20/M25/M40 family metallo-hydrolase [Croceivirga thetidis]|uniref:Vacuolar membrane protease n=1 Tax=Croceivirga thetidis TaxID=2721623 RepID=A0ABX1GLX2_9FLAO|nr:M20/M25/M40 family metallo-hydrolase [Croceivirga thetidis]NKI30883.1 M20/M25/M40 family metallo-hydrolase [Croceivirga thetidis]